MTANEPIRRTWLHLLVIVAVVAVQVVPSLFTRDLWRPDEPRYAQVAHEMAATGVYTLPHLNGEVYRQKPPLFFWCSAPLERLGLGMTATRVVTGVAVCGVLWVLYLLCRRRLGSGAALLKAPVLSP